MADAQKTPTPASPRGLEPVDCWLALGFAVGFALLYTATLQRWLWNDGFLVAARLEWGEPGLWPHPAYLPVARALDKLVPGFGHYEALFATSWLPAALGLAVGFLLLRELGLARCTGALATLAFGVSPVHWFFATTIEVHALHFLGVAAAALVTLRAPWAREGRAILTTALAFALVPLTHLTAPLLGPAWLYLAVLAARGQGVRLSPRSVLLRLGPALMLVGFISFALTSLYYWEDSVLGGIRGTAAQIEEHLNPSSWAWWREDVGAALSALLLPLGLGAYAVGKGRVPAPAGLGTLLLLAVLPLLAFTAWWAVPNEGGYLLGKSPFLLMLAAYGLEWPRRALLVRVPGGAAPAGALGAALVCATAIAGWREATAWRQKYEDQHRASRAQMVREVLGERGLLVSFDTWRQPIGLDVRGVREDQRVRLVEDALRDGTGPEHVMADIAWKIKILASEHPEGVVLDLKYRTMGKENPFLLPFAQVFDRELLRHFELEEHPHPHWPLARLRLIDG
jgi:hypothetical protein